MNKHHQVARSFVVAGAAVNLVFTGYAAIYVSVSLNEIVNSLEVTANVRGQEAFNEPVVLSLKLIC